MGSPLELASPFVDELQGETAGLRLETFEAKRSFRQPSPPPMSGHDVKLAAARATLVELERDLSDVASPRGSTSFEERNDDDDACALGLAADMEFDEEGPANGDSKLTFYRRKCVELYKKERQLRDEVERRDTELASLRRALNEA